MTPPDSPSPRTEAETIDFGTVEVTRVDVTEYRKTATVKAGRALRGGTIPTLEGDHSFEAGDYIAGPGAGGEFWPIRATIFEATYAEAAQEAPAPEGLLAGVRPLIEHRVGLYSLAAEKVGMDPEWAMAVIEDRDPYLAKAVAAIRAAAAPSPAEPPRPDDERESGERLARIIQEADAENPEWARGARFVLGWTKGPDDAALEIAFQAVRDPATDPAEARPPEGLDLDRLARAMYAHAVSVYRRDVQRTWDEMLADRSAPHNRKRPHRATNGEILDVWRHQAAGLAAEYARLSARGAEPGGER